MWLLFYLIHFTIIETTYFAKVKMNFRQQKSCQHHRFYFKARQKAFNCSCIWNSQMFPEAFHLAKDPTTKPLHAAFYIMMSWGGPWFPSVVKLMCRSNLIRVGTVDLIYKIKSYPVVFALLEIKSVTRPWSCLYPCKQKPVYGALTAMERSQQQDQGLVL